ncbi:MULTISPECIES: UBP-type zinc finger domain-containing protein [unclassified Streptomyces]|uniref:UBP-type zinc finger domain-containing protein n=1 Tax=unclassified Streptomyces TaxID=2593676 RepID=UPI003327AEDA
MPRAGRDPEGLPGQVSPWTVSPDGGRPDGRACSHLSALPDAPRTPDEACGACRARGWSWVRLRWCAACGHVGCCDSSRGRHAYAHHVRTGHPVVLSLAPDESWAWCFVDEVFLVRRVP